MKKIIAVLIALVLCLSTAFAVEINWTDVADTAASIDPNAQIWTLNAVNCAMWIPEVLQYVELSDEDIEGGYIAYWETEDGAAAMGVQYVDKNGMELADYAAQLADMGITDVEENVINGLPCITYSYTTDEGVAANVVAFTTDAGYVLEFAFTAGDPGYEQISALIAASIQPAE